MSDEGDKTCPLCAEEMDFTDQQLKPCKCGYQICVWCWHQIIDMAEKDETEGRCPACRTPYDKEKIVRMAAKCERLVAEINMERRRSQKAKPKPSEGRKQLSSVRVIRRNLVYIVGLPLDLADESLLQEKEYFGQYGRVLKVSMSRTAAGVVQQFPNNTCSVYITYSKEEEAIQCIRSVHGFVLDGRSLKACFGTTKYCHAWLRNVPCTNPDCLYLHEVGSQDDSFTKDEVISAYTRVQQITGVTNNLPRRSGSMLPPPVNDNCNNSSTAKPILKVISNNTPSIPKSSPPNGISGRSGTLPAGSSWGICSSNQPSVPSSTCTNEPSKQNPGAFLSAVANTTRVPVSHGDVLKKPASDGIGDSLHAERKSDLGKPLKQNTAVNPQNVLFVKPASPVRALTGSQMPCHSGAVDENRFVSMPSDITHSFDLSYHSCRSMPLLEGNTEEDEKMQRSRTDVSKMSTDNNAVCNHSGITRLDCSHSDSASVKSPETEVKQQCCAELTSGRTVLTNEVCVSRAECDLRNHMQSQVVVNADSETEDILSFNSQRLRDPKTATNPTDLHSMTDRVQLCPSQDYGHPGAIDSIYNSLAFGDRESDKSCLSYRYIEKPSGGSSLSNGSLDDSLLFPDKARSVQPIGKSIGDSRGNFATDTIEDGIIANILSLDFDESLTAPQNLSKLLGVGDGETNAHKLSNSWKVQNNNQSRFSFARQEESKTQAFNSYSVFNQVPNDRRFHQGSAQTEDPYFGKLGVSNGLSSNYLKGSDNFTGNSAVFSSNKLSAVSRPPVSAPPGFSAPNQSAPPGFSSNKRIEQTFDAVSGNRLLDSSLLRNSYQTPPVENVVDIELLDPAILAVGQGTSQTHLDSADLDLRSNYPLQLSAFENKAKLQQLFMQNPLAAHQNVRLASIGDNNSSYRTLMDQSQGSSVSPFAQLSSFQQSSRSPYMPTGRWDGWNHNELLRNERLGLNKFYGNYEGSSTFWMPSSGNIYNGKYRI